jgi:hypothetical protein
MQTIKHLLSILYRRSLNQTTNHSKPILIPLLYHTRGWTLKMPSQQVLSEHARVTSLHIIMTYFLLMRDVTTRPHLYEY